eukprot:CAMPEP_0196148418 /NCGR_PEP_ID=MMETSP0910-20130528/27673_1 /TAXON_ID=49265 /ORGANISM="Thalassiosira rotula, Strain GSO102" /LENGTH=307 /DNA_ID=CAMNT_0041411115 /DNA_START=31 /DNA_END=951 /DNA_ORIENTATION=-
MASTIPKANRKSVRVASNRRLQPGRQRNNPVPDEGNDSSLAENTAEISSNSATTTTTTAGGAGDYGTYRNSGSETGYAQPNNNNNAEITAATASETTDTASGTYGGSSAYGAYDPTSSSSSRYGGTSYGGTSYGGGSGSSSNGNPYGNDSYSSTWGTGAASPSASASSSSSLFKPHYHSPSSVSVNILPAVLILLFVTLFGMVVTAHRMEHSPEGTFANCCRVVLHTVNCIYKVIYNLYHCRLSEIPQVVFASELEEDEYTDEEIERMRLRPGIERALDVEHRKALRKVGIEMNKIQVSQKKGGLQR